MRLRVANRAGIRGGLSNGDAVILHQPAVAGPKLRKGGALRPRQPPLRWRDGRRARAEEGVDAETVDGCGNGRGVDALKDRWVLGRVS